VISSRQLLTVDNEIYTMNFFRRKLRSSEKKSVTILQKKKKTAERKNHSNQKPLQSGNFMF